MTREEKAEELSDNDDLITIAESNAAYNAALEAMDWILDKTYKWLEKHAREYNLSESDDQERLVTDLRKAMEE